MLHDFAFFGEGKEEKYPKDKEKQFYLWDKLSAF